MKVPEEYRVKISGKLPERFASDSSLGNNGAFIIPSCVSGRDLIVIASDGEGWEHVSVSAKDNSKIRTPVWDEMNYIKDLFWDEEECVVQFHPPKKEYVNNQSNTLHLWKPIGKKIETPPSILVGVKELGKL